MKTKALQTLAVMGIASIAIAGSVKAATFTVYGTGNSGTAPVHSTDPNFTLVSSIGGPTVGPSLVVTQLTGSFAGYAVNSPDTATAEWINPTSFPVGTYIYQETFNLSASDILSTAQISGIGKADDYLQFIYLNGVKVFTGAKTNNAWSSNTANAGFVINSGFQTGLNTLDFVVPNLSGPTALFVQINSATVSIVPEPSTVAVYVLGSLALLGFVVRKKRIS